MKSFRALLAAGILVASCGFAAAQNKDLKIVLAVPVDIVEPCNMAATSYVGIALRENIVETLTTLSPEDSSPQPLLATKWEQINEKTWRFTLRPGVTFHDGKPFNAEAVKIAVERLFKPELLCRDKIRLFGDEVMEANVIDEHTVEFVTPTASPLLPITMASVAMTSPGSSMTEPDRHPAGTGPYIFESWDPSNNLVFVRNEKYWGEKPQAEKVTYIWRGESALRAQMVAVGEADIAINVAPQDATNPDTDIGYLNADTMRARLFMDKEPLSDIRVRKAMNLAIDRNALIGTILSAGAIPASQFILPSIAGYNHDLKPWPYDPDQARELIEEARAAGVNVDAPIRIFAHTEMANATEMYETLMQYWRDIGLKVELQIVDKIELSKIRRKPFPNPRDVATIAVEFHDNTSGDAIFTLLVYHTSEGQLSNISDPRLDGIIEKAAMLTGDKRKEMFAEANRIIQQEIIPDVVIAHIENFIRVGPRVKYTPNFTTQGKLRLAEVTFTN